MLPVITPFAALAVLRMMCGFFFLPHAIGKFSQREAAIGFFAAAGFKPAAPFAYASMTLEVVMAACLLLNMFVVPAAWIACAYLLVATAAVVKVERKWLWHIGGCEYPLFWALCCGLVAASYRGLAV